jgi:hypothetical protein
MICCKTSRNPASLLLAGDNGTVVCSVHGEGQRRVLPSLSPEGGWIYSHRTWRQMRNLAVVRGVRGQGMVGPLDFFGDLRSPGKADYKFTITPDTLETTQVPRALNLYTPRKPSVPVDNCVYITPFEWLSGVTGDNHAQKGSLFPAPGELRIPVHDIRLPEFDATQFDLSPFGASLVCTDRPITVSTHPTELDMRLISYHFDKDYAQRQIERGPGLFLEQHSFSQLMIPMTRESGGVVMLARRVGETLVVIGVQIPSGWCLIIEPWCIHGDTTLYGKYVMGMTSDHVVMSTADTVFLKHETTRENVRVCIINQPNHKQGTALRKVVFQGEPAELLETNPSAKLISTPHLAAFWRQFINRLRGSE